MKKKITSAEYLKNFFAKQEWKVKSLVDSPLPEIKLPSNYLFVVGSGSMNMVSNYSGPSIAVAGMDIFRRDFRDYPYIINANHYSIFSTQDKKLFEIVEDKPEYHWLKSLSDIPKPILNALPSTTINNLEELLKQDLNDAIGLAVDENDLK